MAASPSPLNYFIGKGTLSYTPAGGSPQSMGNCPSFKLSPNFEFLEHFSSQAGVKEKDDEVLVSKAGTVEITLDEITVDNLQIVLFGEEGTATTSEFEIFSASAMSGALTLTGTNDKGNRFLVTLPKVNWKPTEGVDFISEEWGIITLAGEVLKVDGSFGTIEQTAVGTL